MPWCHQRRISTLIGVSSIDAAEQPPSNGRQSGNCNRRIELKRPCIPCLLLLPMASSIPKTASLPVNRPLSVDKILSIPLLANYHTHVPDPCAPGTQSGVVPALQLLTPLLVPAAWYGLAFLASYRVVPCTSNKQAGLRPVPGTTHPTSSSPPSG